MDGFSGPATANIVKGDRLRIGDDRPLWFKVTLADDVTVPSDLASWDFEWALRTSHDDESLVPVLDKVSPAITVISVPDPFYEGSGVAPAVNVVQVPLLRTDYPVGMREGTYWQSLARTDTGSHLTLAEGWAEILKTATR